MRFSRVQLPHWRNEGLPDRPFCGPVFVVGVGIILPLVLALYGTVTLARGEAVIIGYSYPMTLYGVNAAIFGVGVIALAVLLHCAAFWDTAQESSPARARIKIACLCVMGLCAYVLCLRMLPGLWG